MLRLAHPHRSTSTGSRPLDHYLTADITATLATYELNHGPPSGRADVLHSALAARRAVTGRHDLPVHVTCGVVALNDSGQVLQIQHMALGRWLFPGGHLEPHDESLTAAAVRELAEETGLHIKPEAVEPLPVHVDVHAIPTNEAKAEPEHWHADFRYLARVDHDSVQLQPDEVDGWRWSDPARLDLPWLARI